MISTQSPAWWCASLITWSSYNPYSCRVHTSHYRACAPHLLLKPLLHLLQNPFIPHNLLQILLLGSPLELSNHPCGFRVLLLSPRPIHELILFQTMRLVIICLLHMCSYFLCSHRALFLQGGFPWTSMGLGYAAGDRSFGELSHLVSSGFTVENNRRKI